MKITANFTLEELTVSGKAKELGLSNAPNAEELARIKVLATALERVRAALGSVPILISSAFRNAAVNKAVGGVPNSDHQLGYAADFTAPRAGTVEEVCKKIVASDIPFDQIIFEQRGATQWVHLSVHPRMRRELLSWSPAKGYVPGIVRL